MVGMMQIMIWMLCVYLVFKGVEIFQIAFVSPKENSSRGSGIALGVVMIVVAVVAAIAFFVIEEQMAQQISNTQRSLPSFTP